MLLIILIASTNCLQGQVSFNRAINTQQQLNYYLKKYDLQFKLPLINLAEFKDFDEITNQRYTTKCDQCNKTFKNSSYLLMHQYNHHFDVNLTETIIYLNYFCEITHCTKNYQSNSIQPLPKNIRIQKCLKFCQEYIDYSVLEIVKLNQFCDEIVLDNIASLKQETPIWDSIVNIIETIIIIIYIIGSMYIIKKIQEYVHFLQRRHKKQQPKNYKEKYTVM